MRKNGEKRAAKETAKDRQEKRKRGRVKNAANRGSFLSCVLVLL